MTEESTGATERDRDDGADGAPAQERAVSATLVGALAGGVAGTAVMALLWFAARATVAPNLRVFRTLAGLAGAGDDPFLGFVLFVAAGVVAWPLLYVTLGAYLPGSTRPVQATVFALVLWVGFAVAFVGESAENVAAFVALSVLAHVVYGVLLGLTIARFTGVYRTPEIRV